MNETQSMISTIKRKGVTNQKVLLAMSQINRKIFVLDSSKNLAYSDLALPIGESQTISQPYMVAKMLELLNINSIDKVLEIGSGSGYVCAILSKLAKKVIGIEIIKELSIQSKKNLKQHKISNVTILHNDGSEGLIQGYPYDKILISAATPKIIPQLIDQLKIGGILLAPIGDRMHQTLTKITKTKEGYKKELFDACMFVPLKGKQGF